MEGALSLVFIGNVSGVKKEWADEFGVRVESVRVLDAVWRCHGELEGSLEELRRGKGRMGLYLHGGGSDINWECEDVRSGGSVCPRDDSKLKETGI